MSHRRLLIDTHASLWWVTGNPKLSARAKAAMEESIAADEFDVVAVDLDIADKVREVPLDWTNDPWDRTIIATTLLLGTTLVTKDSPHRFNDQIDTLW